VYASGVTAADEVEFLATNLFDSIGAVRVFTTPRSSGRASSDGAYEAIATAGCACGPPYCIAVAGAEGAATNCLRYPATLTKYWRVSS
jgi:hypothetical protein